MQENNTVEQIAEVTPDTTIESQEIEQTQANDNISDNEETAVSYGKFKSAESLYEGYQQLQKEFTKKCQVLKELENRVGDNKHILDKMIEVNPELGQFADELKNVSDVSGISLKLAELQIGRASCRERV